MDKKKWFSYILDYPWTVLLSTSLASVVLLGSIIALTYSFTGFSLYKATVLYVVWVLSASIGIFTSYISYLTHRPAGLENESHSSRRIAIFRRDLWQFKLAHALLNDRVAKLDVKLEGILKGSVYVPITEKLGTQEYLTWVDLRRQNVLRLVEVLKTTIFDGLLVTLSSMGKNPDVLTLILTDVSRIEEVYRATVDFNLAWRSVLPPDEFSKLHDAEVSLVAGVREGIKALLQSLQLAASTKLSKNTMITITIKIPLSDTFVAYEREYERLLLRCGSLLR
ncbi:MAG: hypothetical protein ACTSWQ_10490 [Candidatus Thorarchaeota archaeon]